jgi:hypothetical protein
MENLMHITKHDSQIQTRDLPMTMDGRSFERINATRAHKAVSDGLIETATMVVVADNAQRKLDGQRRAFLKIERLLDQKEAACHAADLRLRQEQINRYRAIQARSSAALDHYIDSTERKKRLETILLKNEMIQRR